MSLSSGTRLGPYEILSPLGAGGMGEMYRAKDPRLGREVAVKVLPTSFSKDPDRLRRFEHEARAAGVLNHPNITAVYDIGSVDGAPYVVSELLEGETLRSRLATGALSPRKALDYATQIARGLAAAHEKGIVHRDLKPENLFVTRDGRVKILDFGLAKLKQPEEGSEKTDLATATAGTEPGVVLGTMGYMSPEQVRGKAADYRSDIFAFGAEALSGIAGPRALPAALPAAKIQRPWLLAAAAAAVAALIAAAITGPLAYRSGKKAGYVPPPSFFQLSFQRGEVGGSFFAPDGQTIIYSAAWEGKPMEVFVHRAESPESRPFGLRGEVLGMSRTGEMAVSLNRRPYVPFVGIGRLARISIAGGAPREVLDDVQWADWSADGKDLAIVRDVGAHNRLEFPIGKVIYETEGWIGHARVSPDGERIAFVDHPVLRDDGGSVAVIDRSGKKATLTPIYATAQGLAWRPDGREIWFTAAEGGFNRAIHAVSLSGQTRVIGRIPGVSTLKDISKDGRVLMANETYRLGILGRRTGDQKEIELSWLDFSLVSDISSDGSTILLTESGEGGGPGYSAYLRKLDGSPAVRLGEGRSDAFSPDGRWALCILHPATDATLVAVPTGVGETRTFNDELRVRVADWFPDGKRILITATEPGHGMRLFVRDFAGGKARPLTPEGYRHFERAVSLDGRFAAVRGPDRRIYLYPLGGGEPTPLSGLTAEDVPVRFDREGRWLYFYRQGEVPLRLSRYEISSGRKETWKEVSPADTAGLSAINRMVTTPDGQAYAYSYFRVLSYLQIVDGLK